MFLISLLLTCVSFFGFDTAQTSDTTPGPLFISNDQGMSWDNFGEGLPSNLMVRDILEYEGKVFLTSINHGVYVLPKFSCTWQEQNNGLPSGGAFEFFPTSLAAKGKLLVLGTFNHGVFHSTDQGQTWTVARQNIPDVVSSLLIVDENTVIAGAHKGIWKSTDGGVNWQLVVEEENRINGLVEHKGRFFVARQNGMGLLQGNEVVWSSMTSDFAIIRLTSAGDYVYAITANNEVFRSKDGQFWESNAFCLKGIPSKTVPEAHWNGLSPKLPGNVPAGLVSETSRGWLVGTGGGC